MAGTILILFKVQAHLAGKQYGELRINWCYLSFQDKHLRFFRVLRARGLLPSAENCFGCLNLSGLKPASLRERPEKRDPCTWNLDWVPDDRQLCSGARSHVPVRDRQGYHWVRFAGSRAAAFLAVATLPYTCKRWKARPPRRQFHSPALRLLPSVNNDRSGQLPYQFR